MYDTHIRTLVDIGDLIDVPKVLESVWLYNMLQLAWKILSVKATWTKFHSNIELVALNMKLGQTFQKNEILDGHQPPF